MAKEDDRGATRHEETFSTLSEGAAAASSGDGAGSSVETAIANWKMTTIALLVVTLVLVILYSSESLKEEKDVRYRAGLAKDEIEAAGILLEEGDVPNAVLALHDAGMQFAASEPEGAEATAMRVKSAVENLRDQVRRRTADVKRLRDRIAGMEDASGQRDARDLGHLRALEQILAGRPAAAREALGTPGPGDAAGRLLVTLVSRLNQLDAAYSTEGEKRAELLSKLAAEWPLTAIGAAGDDESEAAATRGRIRDLLAGAGRALERDDPDSAAARLTEASQAAEVGDLYELLRRHRDVVARARAEELEKDGDFLAAAGLYRTLAEDGDEDAGRRAEALANEVRSRDLGQSLERLADDELAAKDYAAAAALMDAYARVTGVKVASAVAARTRATGLVERAEGLLARGEPSAARMVALEAAAVAPGSAERVMRKIEKAQAQQALEVRAARAREALEAGAPDYAKTLVPEDHAYDLLRAKVEQARTLEVRDRVQAALDDGAPALALEILEQSGVAVSDQALDTCRNALAEERREKIAALLQLDAADRALALLTSADSGERWRALAAQAELQAGSVKKGMGLLPTDSRRRALALLKALADAPERAGQILANLETPSEWAPDVLAAVATALESAGRKDDAKTVWASLRDVVLRYAPLPKPENERKQE